MRRNGINRTLNATSGYSGGMRSASVSAGGPVGRSGQYVSRDQRRRDMRVAFGLAAG